MTSIMPMEGLLLDARNVRKRRVSPIALDPPEGPLTDRQRPLSLSVLGP